MSIIAIIIAIAIFVVYFLPVIVMELRGAKTSLLVLSLNLFLGWTVIMWFAALIMAFAIKVEEKQS